MLEILETLLGGVLSGGATGILGVIVQRWADYKNKQADLEVLKVKNDHEVRMREADAAIMAQEWAARTKVAEVEGATKEAVADAAALATSYGMEPQRFAEGVKFTRGQGWVMVALDTLRGAVRPLLTVYLCAITTMMYVQMSALIGGLQGSLSEASVMKIIMLIITTVLYLTTTCVLWWFGTRNKGRQLQA